MLFNEIDNFIVASIFGRIDQIPTKELHPKTLYSFNNL